MPDDLRTRIAAVVGGHAPWPHAGEIACTCAERFTGADAWKSWESHVADAVIREMGRYE